MPLLTFIVIAILALAIVQIYAGGIGIAYHFGLGWAISSIIMCLFFRFSIPITIGCFFCAKDVWGWHWFYSLLFAAPGLIFAIPYILVGILAIFNDLYKNFKK